MTIERKIILHRIKTKLMTLALAVCVLFAAAPAVLASDIEGHPAQKDLESFIEKGYLTGYEDGSYEPDRTMTRAEFAALVNRVAGLTEESADIAKCTDVVSGSWYYKDMAKALAAGYMSADANTLSPNDPITARQAAEMLEKVFGTKVELTGAARADIVSALAGVIGAQVPAGLEDYRFVLMNIPYADFYAAEVKNEAPVDAVTSATLNKTRTSTLVAGSYHVDSEGTDITGITFPVAVPKNADLSAYTKVTDSDSVTISVTNRGQTSETVYTGKDALFQNVSYAYYELSSVPAYYKVAAVSENGGLTFGKAVGKEQTLSDASATITTESSYGDYQISVKGLDGIETVYAVVLSTKEGGSYGLRHLENVWRVGELSWCTGFTKSVHNCPTSSDHYTAMMGQTIDKIVYYTDSGIYTIPVDLYVPVKFESTLTVAEAAAEAKSAALTMTGFPKDYEAVYAVTDPAGNVRDTFSCDGKTLTWTEASAGASTLLVSDASGKYAPYSVSFTLTTSAAPAKAAEDGLSLVKAEGASDVDYACYLASITSVNVNGTDYAAAGRGAVAVIDKSGKVDFSTAAFTELAGQTVTVTVTATGYPAVSLTVPVPETLPVAENTQQGGGH